MKANIISIKVVDDFVEIILNIKTRKTSEIKVLLNDFDEVIDGNLVDDDVSESYFYRYRFELTDRFHQFHDGILKIIFGKTKKNILYYTIYSLKMWEEYTDDIDKIESYFCDLEDCTDFSSDSSDDSDYDINHDDEDIDVGYIIEQLIGNDNNQNDEIDGDNQEDEEIENTVTENVNLNEGQLEEMENNKPKPKYLYNTNGYLHTWLSISLDEWSLQYTSNSDSLCAEFILTYQENQGNVLNDLEFYITTKKGSIIYDDGYLTRDGPVPKRIDIWMDDESHRLIIGPSFSSLKKDDERIQEGIRLTMCFKDVKQGYYVRKTYVMECNMWYHEELYAVPLNNFH